MPSTRTSAAPTVRDVAAMAGVSPMTVSRTMSGGHNVRPEVQERVRRAVDALGYRRNDSARNTRLGRSSGLIGIVVTNMGNPYYGQFALGVEEVASEYHRGIVMGNTAEDANREHQLITDFASRQIEGLILVPAGNGSQLPDDPRLAGIPLVLAARSIDGFMADTVLVDDIHGSRAGTEGLLADGHRSIAFLGDVAGISTSRRRYEGFCQALTEAGLSADPALLVQCRDSVTAHSESRRLLSGPVPPTAFFSANNRTTVGILRAIAERRVGNASLPTPSVACFDDVELADLLGIPLIVMSHDPKDLGVQAARLLFDRLNKPEADRAKPRSVDLAVTIRRY